MTALGSARTASSALGAGALARARLVSVAGVESTGEGRAASRTSLRFNAGSSEADRTASVSRASLTGAGLASLRSGVTAAGAGAETLATVGTLAAAVWVCGGRRRSASSGHDASRLANAVDAVRLAGGSTQTRASLAEAGATADAMVHPAKRAAATVGLRPASMMFSCSLGKRRCRPFEFPGRDREMVILRAGLIPAKRGRNL